MDVTARIEMRPRHVGRGAVEARRRGVVWHTTRARHLNLIPGCVWSLASPAAYIATVAFAHTRVCVRTCSCMRPSKSIHARATTNGASDGLRHSRRSARRGNAVRTCPLATFYRGVVRVHVHAHPARGTRKSIPRHEVGYSGKTIKGSRVSMLLFKWYWRCFLGRWGSNVGDTLLTYTRMKFSSSGDYSLLFRFYINKHVALF